MMLSLIIVVFGVGFSISVNLSRIARALEREGERRDRVAMLEREGVE